MSSGTAPESTLMFREAAEASQAVSRQRRENAAIIGKLAKRLRSRRPNVVITLARGSSDHAATFARYLIETRAGVLTSSASPSVGSIYDSTPDLTGTMVLAISQSGRSPDLIDSAIRARQSGALLVAMVNDEGSPLAATADVLIPLRAGPELSVAATKSFIATLAAIVDLLAAWTTDRTIDSALSNLPEGLAQAWQIDWSPALKVLTEASAMYVVARGHALGAAQEAALKLKETCGIQAEAFSAAEVRHGPMALVQEGFPLLLFGQPDESLDGVTALAEEFAKENARIISAGLPRAPGIQLPVIAADALVAPILEIASFYRLANSLALARGRNPDHPPHLAKVTETR